MTLTPDLTLLLKLFFESIINVTITFSVVKKKYHQFFFKIKSGRLIVNLIFSGKCDLRKVSSHRCQKQNTKVEKERKIIVKRRMWNMNIIPKIKITKLMQITITKKGKTAKRTEKKAISFLLTKMMTLIHIQMQIKPILKK